MRMMSTRSSLSSMLGLLVLVLPQQYGGNRDDRRGVAEAFSTVPLAQRVVPKLTMPDDWPSRIAPQRVSPLRSLVVPSVGNAITAKLGKGVALASFFYSFTRFIWKPLLEHTIQTLRQETKQSNNSLLAVADRSTIPLFARPVVRLAVALLAGAGVVFVCTTLALLWFF